MAKRKAARAATAAAQASPSPPPAGPAPEPRAPLEPPRLWPTWLLPGAGALTLLLAFLASPAGEGLDRPGLWTTARWLAATAGLGAIVAFRLAGPARQWVTGAAALLATLALMAALGRNPQLHLAAFELAHPNFVGFPAALAFVLLGAGARAWARAPDSRLAATATVAGLVWATATLLFPHTWLGELRLPLGLALDGLSAPALSTLVAALVVTACALPVLAGWVTALATAHGRSPTLGDLAASSRPVLVHAPWLFVAHHAVAPWLADAPAPGAALAGLLVAALVAALTLLTEELLVREAQAPLPDPHRARVRLTADLAVPAAVLALYGLLKIHGMGPSNTDENIYFYMAADLANGRWPYVDYFFAHPPLHVLVPGAFFAVFGYSLTLAKLFSVTAGAVAGLAVWAIGRRAFGRLAAAFAMVAFLFAAETLKATTNMTGINLTTMWLMLGLWQSLKGRGLTAGLLFGAAATTGFYSMAGICAALLLGAFRDRRFALRQLAGFALVFGSLNLIFLAAAGDAFVDGVYRYHGLKTFADARMVPLTGGPKPFPAALVHNLAVMVDGSSFTKEVYYHAHLWISLAIAPALGLAAWLLSPEGRARPLRFLDPRRFWEPGPHAAAALVFLFALALFIQYSMFRELYSFYFTLIYPALGLLLAYVVVHGAQLVASAVTDEAGPRRDGLGRMAAGVATLAAFCLWVPWALKANAAFPDEAQQRGARNEYTWTPAPMLQDLSAPAHALFWEDYRLKGNMEPGYRYYLWTKKRHFVTLDEVAAFVAERTGPEETIAGASTLAPLIALAAERRLAAGEADTNNKRFRTGLLSEADYWDAICADDVRFIVSAGRSYFTPQKLASLPTARRWFKPVKTFQDPQLTYGGLFPITLFERVGDPGPELEAAGKRCQWEGPRPAPAKGE